MGPLSCVSSSLRHRALFALLAAILLISLDTASARRAPKRSRPEKEFFAHMLRVRGFSCSVPQRRAVSSFEVLATQGISTAEYITPPQTVLHRCDAMSGCCDQAERMTCAPASTEEIPLLFSVINKFTKKARFVVATAENHTACACAMPSERRKLDKVSTYQYSGNNQ